MGGNDSLYQRKDKKQGRWYEVKGGGVVEWFSISEKKIPQSASSLPPFPPASSPSLKLMDGRRQKGNKILTGIGGRWWIVNHFKDFS